MRRYDRYRSLMLTGAMLVASVTAGTGATSDPIKGKLIFEQGIGVESIDAVMAGGELVLPATALTCVGCHGSDGRGGSEGAVIAPDVRWSALTRPSTFAGAMSRSRQAYDEVSFVRAVTMGFDSSSNVLHRAMPRFRFSQPDVAHLLAYLKQLDQADVDGVDGESITVALLTSPVTGSQRVTQCERLLRDNIDRVNRSGGIFGRSLRIVSSQSQEDPDERASVLRTLIAREKPLLLLAPYFAGAEKELEAVVEELRVPTIGPLGLAPPSREKPGRFTFWLIPGQEDLVRLQARRALAGSKDGDSPVYLLIPVSARQRHDAIPDEQVAEIVATSVSAADARRIKVEYFQAGASDAVSVVARVNRAGAQRVLLVGDQLEAETLIGEIHARNLALDVFVLSPGTAARLATDSDRFGAHATGIHLAFPDVGGNGSFFDSAATLSGSVMIEALRRAGRGLDREKLVTALESLNRFRVDGFPVVSFAAGQHRGMRGAKLVSFGGRVKNGIEIRWEPLEPRGDVP